MRRRLAFLASLLAVALGALASPALAGKVDDGRRLLGERRYAEAAAAFGAAVESDPASKEALLGYARAVTDGRLVDAYDQAMNRLHNAVKGREDRALRLALGDLFLARAEIDPNYNADAEVQFKRLLQADPADEDAAVGLARRYYFAADPVRGLQAVDALLATKPQSALALYWKGVLLFDQAEQTFKAQGGTSLPAESKALFEKAVGVLEASAKGDPKRHDTWMRLAYAQQYLLWVDPVRAEAAAAAYEKALDVDGDSDLPVRGLKALSDRGGDPAKWPAALEALVARHPKAAILRYWRGFALAGSAGGDKKRLEEAEKEFRAYLALGRGSAAGHVELGVVLQARGDEAGARKEFEEALRLEPAGPAGDRAAVLLQQPLLKRFEDAGLTAAAAREAIQAHAPLLATAPRNIDVRNNLAFFLRESYGKSKADDVLRASIRYYLEASALIPEWNEALAQSTPYPTRHGYAQVLNDTGLMFQFYPASLDLPKAEEFYVRAQEWTEHGYGDAFGNLLKVYEGQGRWQEAYDYALACAQGLKNPDGTPDPTRRALAEGRAKSLEDKVPR